MRSFSFFLFLLPFAACAQLIPAGQPIPKGANPPVVFLNGYQFTCPDQFSTTFGIADQVLESNGIVSLFFDNCTLPNKPDIETLGNGFGTFLAGLKYTDGTAVTTVDVVAHSMGGLIVRTYLSGKQDTPPGVFNPPAAPGIRKAIFLGTPHFGTAIASDFGIDAQTNEMALGSQFLFDLNSWNQGTDDLRGIDAIAVAGDAGSGLESGIPQFDDGVVALTSSSLGFYQEARTRVVPYCHTQDSLLTTFGYCPSSAPFLAEITDANSMVAQILVSFLTGTSAWQSVGAAMESDPVGSLYGGTIVEAQNSAGTEQPILEASATSPSSTVSLSTPHSGDIAYSDRLSAKAALTGAITIAGPTTLTPSFQVSSGVSLAVYAKPGPVVLRALPAGSSVFPLNVAPGEFVAVYGTNLSSTTQTAGTATYPAQLADLQVLVSGSAIPIEYISPNQLNIVFPNISSGITQLTVMNSAGSHTINVLPVASVPSIFTLDGSGSGPAAALNAVTSQVVGTATPLHAGDYVSLYLTGLGLTTAQNNLQYAQIIPTVIIGGQVCLVSYAGRAPGFEGLDQINCQLAAGTSTGDSVPVVVTSNGRDSNAVTLAIE